MAENNGGGNGTGGNGDFIPSSTAAGVLERTVPEVEAREADGEAELDLEAVTEAEQRAAQGVLNAELGADVREHIASARALLKETEDQEYGYPKDPARAIEDKYNRMNARLMSKLSKQMAVEKQEIERKSCTGVRKILKAIGIYKPKEINDEEVLESVTSRLIKDMEKVTEKRRTDRETMKKAYEDVTKSASGLNKSRNSFYDVYEAGERKLTSLQEQLTANIKARDQYLEAKNKPDYHGEVDALLKNTIESMDQLEGQIKELSDTQRELKDNLSDQVVKTRFYGLKEDRAKVNYDIAKREHRKSKLTRDLLVEIRDDNKGRESLLSFYKAIANDRELIENGKAVIGEANLFIEQVIGEYEVANSDIEGFEKLLGDRGVFVEYRRGVDKAEDDNVAKAKALRYGLDHA